MTDTTARAENAAAAHPEGPEQTAANPEATAPAAGQAPEADSAALAREAADFKDKLLRTLAEMENLRRRTEREVADARAYGIAGFARDMLNVADNMQRALEAMPAELRQNAEAGIKALVEGVELTERELSKALEKNGVRRFDPKGEKFDPNVHQAMFEVPDPAVPSGMVAQVMQPGYMIGERVLRPALVGVSKGAPKAAPAAQGSNDNSASGGAAPAS